MAPIRRHRTDILRRVEGCDRQCAATSVRASSPARSAPSLHTLASSALNLPRSPRLFGRPPASLHLPTWRQPVSKATDWRPANHRGSSRAHSPLAIWKGHAQASVATWCDWSSEMSRGHNRLSGWEEARVPEGEKRVVPLKENERRGIVCYSLRQWTRSGGQGLVSMPRTGRLHSRNADPGGQVHAANKNTTPRRYKLVTSGPILRQGGNTPKAKFCTPRRISPGNATGPPPVRRVNGFFAVRRAEHLR